MELNHNLAYQIVMRFFNAVFLQVLILILLSCSSKTGPTCCAPPNADIEFSIVDSGGKDRLNPDHPHSLTEQNLDLYHVKEEEKQRFDTGIKIHNSEETYFVSLVLSNFVDSGYTKTLLEFPNSTTDTLKMEPLNDEGRAVDKLWYNDELVYDVENPKLFEVTKPVTTD